MEEVVGANRQTTQVIMRTQTIFRYSLLIVVSMFLMFQVWEIRSSVANYKTTSRHYHEFTVSDSSEISVQTSSKRYQDYTIRVEDSRTVVLSTDHDNNHQLSISTPQRHVTPHNQQTQTPQETPTTENPIHFPHGDAVRPMDEILKAPWVHELQGHLDKSITSQNSTATDPQHQVSQRKQVSLVAGDEIFMSSIINWLVAAKLKTTPPINNVIIVSFSRRMNKFLNKKWIPSVYVDSETVIRPGTKMKTKFSHIWITRCTVYRLLNYWGFDVAVYDSDAIVMKNLQPIFDANRDIDVIGSTGSYPFELGNKWGQTICMGMAFFRSTPQTDLLWETMAYTRTDKFDDQVRINYILENCDIHWQKRSKSVTNQVIIGQCAPNHLRGLRAALLPESVVCRNCNASVNSYYVMHHISKKNAQSKLKDAQVGKRWYLRSGWKKIGKNLIGLKWLSAIMN